MRIYVAAKWELKAEVRRLYAVLRQNGHTITHDWTVVDGNDENTSMAQCAADDLHGVIGADALVLVPHYRGAGLWVELGAALAMGKPVFVCADRSAAHLCVFLALPACRFVDDDACLLAALDEIEAPPAHPPGCQCRRAWTR